MDIDLKDSKLKETRKIMIFNEKSEVKKSEALVKSRYKLNPLALKLVTTVISCIQSDDSPEQKYCLKVKDFTDLANVKGNGYYKALDDATEEIMKKPLSIPLGGKSFLKVNWCSSIKYKESEGIIEFKISEDLIPHIKDLKKNYLKYNLANILRLRSDYSIRIYEFLKDSYNTNFRYQKGCELTYTIQELRDRLSIPDSYRFDHIKEKILEKAKIDLLELTDIKFIWEIAQKEARKVTHIRFIVSHNFRNSRQEEKIIPNYLKSYMNYVNYLRENYSANDKFFFVCKFVIDGVGIKDVYYFSINSAQMVFALKTGEKAIILRKDDAEKIMNISYICSLHSGIYRNCITEGYDFYEFSKSKEDSDFFKEVITDINRVIRENDINQRPSI